MKVTRPSILASRVHHDNVAGSNAPNDTSRAPQIPTQNAISPAFALADDLVGESCERKDHVDKPVGTMSRAEHTDLVNLNASSDAHYDTRVGYVRPGLNATTFNDRVLLGKLRSQSIAFIRYELEEFL